MTRLLLPLDKTAARRVVRAARRERRAAASDEVWRELDNALADHLMRWIGTGAAPATVALYESLPTEPPTAVVVETLRENGIRPIVPILLADMDLSWRDIVTGDDLGVDAITGADLIVTPGLAVSRVTGLRLGQGGGSYDRALLRVRPGTRVVTMLFDDELVEHVPADPHDRAVDAVLTPSAGFTDVGRAV